MAGAIEKAERAIAVQRKTLAVRLKEHGLSAETEASIKAKLRRGTFAATFLLATIAALEMEGFRLADLQRYYGSKCPMTLQITLRYCKFNAAPIAADPFGCFSSQRMIAH